MSNSRSKFLALILRHKPETIGLSLDYEGWASVDELMEKMPISWTELSGIVANDDKRRYAFNEDETKIRASQGHSIQVDLGLNVEVPPGILYHGTARRNLPSIQEHGLLKGERQYVHLSWDTHTAAKVGRRHSGEVLILKVRALEMYNEGLKFFLSENGVWLTDHVPPKFVSE